VDAALAMQETVYAALAGKNNPDVFGMQVVANERGEVEDFEERLLIGATSLSIDAIAARAHALGGLVIPAHVDRQAYGLVGQLGFIPPDLKADALEVSYRMKAGAARATIPGIGAFPLVTSSDAHDLPDLGRAVTRFYLETRSLAEIRMALRGEDGRRAEID
jgi:PHP family Zn ribbon phosphoesterase